VTMIPNLIVPVLNRYDLLQRMISSIDYPIRHLFIIDNGEGPEEILEIPDWVREITYTPVPSNLGVAASWNLGIKSFPHHNRWFFASNDMYFEKGALEKLGTARTNELTLCDVPPYFQTFVVGEEVVEKIGLFDEIYYPAYFEDSDFIRRVEKAGLTVTRFPVSVSHDNSSTIQSDEKLRNLNDRTFQTNRDIYRIKEDSGDYSVYGWSLSARRLNSWD
jgi:GT2 family glycosyltransferase